jgi:hypothetical protein
MQNMVNRFDPSTADRIIESLRFGVPPADNVRAFTVGRREQMAELERSLELGDGDQGSALLVKANYGAGKSHLLKVIREMALDAGYAVSLVVVNAHEGVRFNRLDTIFGAVCRELEVDHSGQKGVGTLFDAFAGAARAKLSDDMREVRDRISSKGRWDHSERLKAPGMYVALRAWVASTNGDAHALVQDWLSNPQGYRNRRSPLYKALVGDLKGKFRDPRAEWQFYADEVFLFHTGGHRQSWDALADLDLISKAAGLRGFVLLFDEFEDVIQNLDRRDLQEAALLNLFRFFGGERFPGMAYFAVTPDFVSKCKSELLRKGLYDFDYSRFDALPTFQLEEVSLEEFVDLARNIREVHGAAYGWDSANRFSDKVLLAVAREVWSLRSPDRMRRAIQAVVEALDRICVS